MRKDRKEICCRRSVNIGIECSQGRKKLHFGSLRKNKLLADAIMFTSLIIKGHVLTHTLTMLLQQHAKLWYGCRQRMGFLITKYIKIASSSLISWSNNFLHLKNSNKIFLNDKKFFGPSFFMCGWSFPSCVYIIEKFPHSQLSHRFCNLIPKEKVFLSYSCNSFMKLCYW